VIWRCFSGKCALDVVGNYLLDMPRTVGWLGGI